MFTCKDCEHYEVCMDFTTLKESEFCQNYDKQEDLCDYFKNKADFVEVVRCKDCLHFDGEGCLKTHGEFEPNPIDYCSYGERRCEE